MMILAYYFFVGLLSSTSGQIPVISVSGVYVNKSETVTITCTVGGAISDFVMISKDRSSVFRCISPPIPCTNLNSVAAYSVVQNQTAGTTIMTISASNISRDTGNWTCQYGTNSISAPVSLTVGTPPSITQMTESDKTVVIETICTFPYAAVHVSCSLGGTDISCQHNVGLGNSTCSDSNERGLMITIVLGSFTGSASGLLTVRIDNGFLTVSKMGNHYYSFTAATTTTTTVLTTKKEMGTTQNVMTSSNTQTVPITTSSHIQTFPVIPVVIGVSVFILLINIIIICCCCQCCYLYHCRKDKHKEKYAAEFNDTNYNQDANNHTIPDDGTLNPAYVFNNISKTQFLREMKFQNQNLTNL